ncbi:MAG: hypothetical protein RIQ89_640 [Bacteroidota bacterium]|jgi:acetyltransferase-like isoleucine patch superfamily enzyme
MIKYFCTKIIRRRNAAFAFDTAVGSADLLWLMFDFIWAWLRSIKLLLRFKLPGLWFLGRATKLRGVHQLQMGRFVKLGDYVHINAISKEGIVIGNNTGIGAHSALMASGTLTSVGKGIKIGNNVGIGEFAYLGGAGGLEIGDECIIGQYLSCHPENHNYTNLSLAIRHQGVSRQGIKIGNNCWIGAKVTILDGVTIGSNCVIAAGAVVTKSMPSDVIIAGVPARVIREIAASDKATAA